MECSFHHDAAQLSIDKLTPEHDLQTAIMVPRLVFNWFLFMILPIFVLSYMYLNFRPLIWMLICFPCIYTCDFDRFPSFCVCVLLMACTNFVHCLLFLFLFVCVEI